MFRATPTTRGLVRTERTDRLRTQGAAGSACQVPTFGTGQSLEPIESAKSRGHPRVQSSNPLTLF